MIRPPQPADDPFFALTGDPEWNAFIGRQGEEEYYVDGAPRSSGAWDGRSAQGCGAPGRRAGGMP